MKIAFALALALASAIALNWGYVAQHGAASTMPPLSLRKPIASLRALFTHRRWLVGFLVGIGGWVLYIAALRLAPLSLVQATSAGGIAILAVLVPERLTRAERAGVAVAIAGLLLLAASLAGSTAGGHGTAAGVALWLAASAAAALCVAALRTGATLGTAAGILYGAGDVATKAAAGGRLVFVPVLLAAHGLAFACLQLGFQRGRALSTIGPATLLTNSLPIAAGIVLFAEPAGLLRVASFVLVVAGSVLLAGAQTGADSVGAGSEASVRGMRRDGGMKRSSASAPAEPPREGVDGEVAATQAWRDDVGDERPVDRAVEALPGTEDGRRCSIDVSPRPLRSPPSRKEVRMDNARSETPPELVFRPQVPFSWTLRGARAARLGRNQGAGGVRYRIAGVAPADELAALAAFCREHGATLELDR